MLAREPCRRPVGLRSLWLPRGGRLLNPAGAEGGQYGTPIFRHRRPLVPGSLGRLATRLR